MKKVFLATLCAISIASLSVPAYAEDTTIAEQVIYDQDGIKVTVTGFDPSTMFGVGIPILVENNSDENICVQFRDSSVNGYMTDFQASVEVAPGKKANDEITILKSNLEKYGIEQVADLECSLHLFDPDTYTTIVDTPTINIETNLSEKYEQAYDDSGNTVYDENGIKIVSQGIENDDIWGLSPKFYMENNTDQAITIQIRDTSVNGYMLNTSFSSDLLPGKKCINNIVFIPDDLKANNIEEITDLETSFHVFATNEVSQTIVDTPAITINY